MEITPNIKKKIELEISEVISKIPSITLLNELMKREENDETFHKMLVSFLLKKTGYQDDVVNTIWEIMSHSRWDKEASK
ncbi:hypothetical protein [Fusobacterium ulcerans]|uniref:hypothetical protein n=1 Tax=Fusobacterium ulcerans TaxID=861 RepID=UPI001D09DD35|nr:hypothetical protein [Fusobacterium ulcerans]MCB8563713.1 hypothetical protein [Fusobacterium ulcerans]MCB8649692.1 hypothetical protein [Fusobacterium ulcerans]